MFLLKKYFRPLMFIMIAASVAMVWYVQQIETLDPDVVVRINQRLDSDAQIKSYVWNYSRLSVGVIKDQVEPQAFVAALCRDIEKLGGHKVSIEAVDVLKVQQTNGAVWEQVGYAKCR